MANFDGLTQLGVQGKLKYIEKCSMPGHLYDLGEYPGLVAGDGTVAGELYQICDPSVFEVLDKYEEYYPHDRDNSHYMRTRLALDEPKVDAWVYLYNKAILGNLRVASGDWGAYTLERKSSIGAALGELVS